MKLKDILIILTPTFRAHAYLQELLLNNLIPNFAIVMSGRKDNLNALNKENLLHFFRKFQDFEITLRKYRIPYEIVKSEDCNDSKMVQTVKTRHERYVIYTGGGILKDEILGLRKKFIHIHPGIVPKYRGSTCIYYSIINEDKCGATAFFMSKKIDAGEIIAQRVFKKPRIANIDYEYDCFIRSSLLIDIIKNYMKKGKFESKPQNYNAGETYFIIHPVLKHLAILSCMSHEKD